MKELQVTQSFDNQQLSKRLKYALLENIRAGITDDRPVKLPKEEVMAQQLGVSRNALRDVLTSLEEEGYLSRRRSKGTIANPLVVNGTCRLDLEMELGQMIEEEGFEPGFQTLDVQFKEQADPAFGGGESSFLQVEKVFCADGEPVAYCVDRIAGSVAKRGREHVETLYRLAHFEFLERFCQDTISCVLAEIFPVMPEEKAARLLSVPAETPLLCLDDIGFNPDQERILHSTLMLKPGKLHYKILRKRF